MWVSCNNADAFPTYLFLMKKALICLKIQHLKASDPTFRLNIWYLVGCFLKKLSLFLILIVRKSPFLVCSNKLDSDFVEIIPGLTSISKVVHDTACLRIFYGKQSFLICVFHAEIKIFVSPRVILMHSEILLKHRFLFFSLSRKVEQKENTHFIGLKL